MQSSSLGQPHPFSFTRASATAALVLLFLLALPLAAADSQSVKVADMDVRLTNLRKKLKDLHKFRIRVVNGTYYPTNIEARLVLQQQSPSATPGDHMMEVASCTIFKKIQPADHFEGDVHCKGGPFTAWKFEVVRVYRNGKLMQGVTADSSAGKSAPTEPRPGPSDPPPGTKQAPGHGATAAGLAIRLTDLKKKAGSYYKFSVGVRSTATERRSFEGRILLLKGQEIVGRCTVFKKVPARGKLEAASYCKGRPYDSWRFELVRVYDAGGKQIHGDK